MFVAALQYLKAIASLVGVALTAASAAADLPAWVTVAGVIATAVATWAIPNFEVVDV